VQTTMVYNGQDLLGALTPSTGLPHDTIGVTPHLFLVDESTKDLSYGKVVDPTDVKAKSLFSTELLLLALCPHCF
jgi:hypothetical protein